MHPATNATLQSPDLYYSLESSSSVPDPNSSLDSTDDDPEVQFFSLEQDNLLFEQTDSGSNNGWAVYTYGIYNDSDGGWFVGRLLSVEISLLNESGMDFYYPACEVSTQRKMSLI